MTSEAREKKELLKLQFLHKNLNKFLEKLQKEIIQADVEWMNLKAVARNSQNENPQSTSNKPLDEKQKIKLYNFDLQSVNGVEAPLPELNLNPNLIQQSSSCNKDEEFDSD